MRFLTEDEKDAEFHRTRWPRNSAWELATFGNHIETGNGMLELLCCVCHHCVHVPAQDFIAAHGRTLDDPFLPVSPRLRCTKCGRQRSICRGKPYGIGD